MIKYKVIINFIDSYNDVETLEKFFNTKDEAEKYVKRVSKSNNNYNEVYNIHYLDVERMIYELNEQFKGELDLCNDYRDRKNILVNKIAYKLKVTFETALAMYEDSFFANLNIDSINIVEFIPTTRNNFC